MAINKIVLKYLKQEREREKDKKKQREWGRYETDSILRCEQK
jgi:hypothetical protein